MSDTVWVALIGSLSLLGAALISGVVGIATIVITHQLRQIAKVGRDTHTLVNSASLVQLRLYAVAARRVASLTGDQADAVVADEAEKLVSAGEAKQTLVAQK